MDASYRGVDRGEGSAGSEIRQFDHFWKFLQVEANSIAATARLPEVGVQNSIQSSKILVVIIRVSRRNRSSLSLVGIGAFFHI